MKSEHHLAQAFQVTSATQTSATMQLNTVNTSRMIASTLGSRLRQRALQNHGLSKTLHFFYNFF